MDRQIETTVAESEDSQLIARILERRDEKEAYAKLVSKYWRFLIAWVRPRVRNASEAEDVVQETFIRAFRALGKLEDPKRFMNWILKIARNQAADHARRSRTFQSLDRLTEEGEVPASALSVIEDLAEKIDLGEEHRAILEAVNRLPDKYRVVIMLRYFEGLSGSEIAKLLGEPEGTIRNRLFRALEKVRAGMGRTRGLGALLRETERGI
jgi:RNA polymerase sigma-70 factor, ECF subfamily